MTCRKITLLDNAVRLAVAHLRKNKEREKSEDDLLAELQRALDEPAGTETMEEVAAKLFLQPGIESAFVQQTSSLDREPVGKVPGGAGALVYGQHLRDKFRAFVDKGGGKFAEGHGKTAQAAVADAMAQIAKKEQG